MKSGKTKCCIFKDNRGATLVEALVSVLLFAVCGIILAAGFSASGSIMRKGQDVRSKGQQAAAALNGDSTSGIGTAKSAGSLSFSLDGTTLTVPGNYTTATDVDGKTIFQAFVPGS